MPADRIPMATVRGDDGNETTLDQFDLEAGVRHGHIPPGTEVQFAPWTGKAFLRVHRIPELARFLEEPDARFAARLRARPFPRAAAALTGFVVLCALIQQLALGPRMVALGAIGWDACFLDGHWWAVATSHFLHWQPAPLVHALGNAGYLAYCGYRVEQAWGASGFVKVVAFAMAVSATAILFGESVPVIGSSTIAFGLLGGQIAIGFRQGEAIPAGWRNVYGWGTAIAAVILVLFHVALDMALRGDPRLATGVSHVAHAGGFFGGMIAVLTARSAVLAPRAQRRRAAIFDLGSAAAVLTAPLALVLGLPLAPAALGAPWEKDRPSGFDVPAHLADHPIELGGFPGWVGAPASGEPFFLSADFDSGDVDRGAWWSAQLGHDVGAIEPREIAPWRVSAWELVDDPLRRRIVELDLPDRDVPLRVAWVVEGAGPSDFEARERLYEEIATRALIRSLRSSSRPRRDRREPTRASSRATLPGSRA
jgi:membrane associated rhomboid family serine protease